MRHLQTEDWLDKLFVGAFVGTAVLLALFLACRVLEACGL